MARNDTTRRPPVAITGMAALMPGAADLETYWQNLVRGVDAIRDVPPDRWDAEHYRPEAGAGTRADEIYCRRGGFVDADVEVTRFGIMPSSARAIEPDQLIALQVAASAIDDAGGAGRLPSRERIGVVLGRGGYLTPGLGRLDQRVRTAHQLVRALGQLVPDLDEERRERIREAFTEQLGPHQPEAAIGLVPNLAASRIANRLDLRGPAYTVDAACASSLLAVDQAVGELAGGRCDVVLAGGVHHCHDITFWSVFSQLGALSGSGRIRPFDSAADGILIGEGTGVVVLKRLSDAERDGDRVYAVIRGTGVASDGRSASLVNPDPSGQVQAVRRAWQAAGLDPSEPGSVGLLEAHGTATPAGDLTELTTLRRVFGGPSPGGEAVIGSVKSMIGHTMPAAGIAGLIKAALAVHRGVLLPTLHCDDPHPALADTRFRPLSSAQPWEPSEGCSVRRAAVNAFGFGGINAHVIVEQHESGAPVYRPGTPKPAVVAEPERTLLLAARTPDELTGMLAAPDAELRDAPRPGPASGDCRLGIAGPTPERLAQARKLVARSVPWRGRRGIWFSPAGLLSAGGGRTAFVFPGLEAEFAPRTDDVADHFGLPRAEVSVEGVGRHGISVLRVGRLLDAALRRMNVRPDAVAGHSVGEWTALIAGGVFADSAVDRLLADTDLDSLRVPGVEFAAIGCGLERVEQAIADVPELVVSHENSANQTVVCGDPAAIAGLVREFRARQVVCQVLPFRSGFHTPMLAPYLAPLRSGVEGLRAGPAAVPVWSATTASPYPADEEAIRELYVRHLLEPVRFRSLVESMHASGVRAFVQVGPGRLGALIDDTLGAAEHLTVAANSADRSGLEQLRRLAVALWVEGAEPDFAVLEPTRAAKSPGRPPMRLDLSTPSPTLDPGVVALARTGARNPGDFRAQPEMAELAALFEETSEAADAVVRAAGSRSAPAPPPETTRPLSTTVRVSTDAMPYLLDHCFARQREGWPDDADRRPVVPAATLIQHMMDAAEKSEPGMKAVAVTDVRLNRWLVAAPPVDVAVTVTPGRADRVTVGFGDYAQATVRLAERSSTDAPPAWPECSGRAAVERIPTLTAREFYRDGWMFHGPRFQGLTELTAIGDRHVRGVITVPSTPGALLDNVGQLLGHWIVETQTHDRIVFPRRIDRIAFHGDQPAPHTWIECVVRIKSTDDTAFEFDAQLHRDGRVWAEITGWRAQRFDSFPESEPAYRFPERNVLSLRMPGDWCLLPEWWNSVSSRELYLHKYLNSAERDDYARLAPLEKRHWLLGRIALKDAVRRLLWDRGGGPVFPAEIDVTGAADGPAVTGKHGLDLPAVHVSTAHCRELAVAIVRDAATTGGVGIAIAEITGPPEDAAETVLLERLCSQTGESRATWSTRFRCAKEAAAKALGTGPGARRFVVESVNGDRLTVRTGRGSRYPVGTEVISNPEHLPPRQYVVAWTTGPVEDEAEGIT